jgi:hypothetical protein
VADNILQRYQDPRLRVYVVWVRRWATDARTEIDGGAMLDQRVVHFWDSGNVIGQPFLERLGVDLGGLDYDSWSWTGWVSKAGWTGRGRAWTP